MKNNSNTSSPLWTRDFTIITLGSVISMLGNSLAGFAMSLMVLDYTGSTLIFAVYMAMYTVPQLIMPVFSGAILDRFSRKKTIYTLDFITAGLYTAVATAIGAGWFSMPAFLLFCFVSGSIGSIYMVAYDSFYPLTITEGNYSKAYSVASVLETMTAIMVPLSVWLYDLIGLAPLLYINALCFLAAAIMETRIKTQESYIELQKRRLEAKNEPLSAARRMMKDVKEGFAYLHEEKGLKAIAVYFTFSSLCAGVMSVITLPYFKSSYINGEYIYMLVYAGSYIGRIIGGAIHYRFRLPVNKKFGIAFSVYIFIAILEGVHLYMPIPVMVAMCFMIGISGVTSYTIRISGTQSYVPDEKKGRFNGVFQMLNCGGMLAAELFSGLIADYLPPRAVLLVFEMICAAAAVIFIGGNRKYVSVIYNREK